MKVKLLKPNKIDGKAGDIVDVSEDRAKFLTEFRLAELYIEQQEAPAEKPARRTRTKK